MSFPHPGKEADRPYPRAQHDQLPEVPSHSSPQLSSLASVSHDKSPLVLISDYILVLSRKLVKNPQLPSRTQNAPLVTPVQPGVERREKGIQIVSLGFLVTALNKEVKNALK